MRAEFWEGVWSDRKLGFHAERPNAFLVEHWSDLGLPDGARVFVPLCGKSLDLHWLHGQGFHVVGVELVEQAVVELFSEMGLTPEVTVHGELTRYAAERLEVWVGDLFALGAGHVGAVDAVYDRAALVALPPDMRARYVPYVLALTDHAPQLLVVFTYDHPSDAAQPEGPPFGVTAHEIRERYAGHAVREVGRVPVELAQGPAQSVARLLTGRPA